MKISKTFTFEAAHRLQNHDGKCRNLHGHSYKVEVTVFGYIQEGPLRPVVIHSVEDTINPQEGMVLDFAHLKKWWSHLEPLLDHRTILDNSDPLFSVLVEAGVDVTEFHVPPTAENLATWIQGDLSEFLLSFWPNGFQTPLVKVYETATSWAEA